MLEMGLMQMAKGPKRTCTDLYTVSRGIGISLDLPRLNLAAEFTWADLIWGQDWKLIEQVPLWTLDLCVVT